MDQAKYPVVMVITHRDTSILQTGILEANVINSNFLLHFSLTIHRIIPAESRVYISPTQRVG
ncbi:hypothetical protein [Massilibacteroides sp.]|uniref:hypothetical protein n=1 Tax=Massilibacteroides sp. TaxID=2034766 RepID=UPI00260BCE95|nr:hypothetical protein [Massilibacteroides sp.]MDD4514492.1 hypothetical protein [Massilibacteroides sp.]MDD4515139.1 hypothetical protein [Massilibacteroides sp.]